jgi:hypothetical protein
MAGKSTSQRRIARRMKRIIFSIGAVVLTVLLASVCAADLAGKWIVKALGREGPVEIIFSFKTGEPDLTGTVSDSQGENAISEGKIDGDEISFAVIRSFGGGEVKLLYKGKVALNEIKFTREVQGVKGRPQEFVAKREFPRHGDVPIRHEAPYQSIPIPERINR